MSTSQCITISNIFHLVSIWVEFQCRTKQYEDLLHQTNLFLLSSFIDDLLIIKKHKNLNKET